MFVEFTPRPGVLRCLQPKDELKRAQGLHFNCPTCMHDKEKAHGVTLLFDLGSVPKDAAPEGRYEADLPCKISELSLGDVKSPYCEWKGWVFRGEVFWR